MQRGYLLSLVAAALLDSCSRPLPPASANSAGPAGGFTVATLNLAMEADARKILADINRAGVYDRGLAILSRYPIRDARVRTLKMSNLRFHNRSRFALAATIDTPGGPVRVWNVHLDTRINPRQRVEQLGPVLEEAAAAGGAKIIGGAVRARETQRRDVESR